MSNTEKDSLVGTRLREYEILEVIGKGGMGAVYRARHQYLEQERAIKVIRRGAAGDKAFVERFIREARILTKLQHPNLVQLYEFGTLEEDLFFMVMELLQGESVLERIRRSGRIPITDAIRIVREAAAGLHSAHQKGIVHRDISPDNLLMIRDEKGHEVTKIIDFGIAKPLFESASGHTLANGFAGKLEYCSPEQCGLLEEDEVIDRRADIYSLGVTFYQMVTARLPFYASTPQGYLLKHAGEQPKPVSAHFENTDFPDALNRIVLKMMAKKRDERHGSMEELISELDSLEHVDLPQPIVTGVRHAAHSPGDLQLGDLFARRYLIEKKIGEGGMGAVYRATDTLLELSVALKILSGEFVRREGALERLKREVILARRVAHPNVCRIYDLGENKGVHYVSMEFLEGRALSEILETAGRLTPEVGLPLIRQSLLALREAHQSGVIHRDLKPQNIMVNPEHKSYIMDFGIAISAGSRRVTHAGAVVGTPQYMAPEQFGESNMDQRSDIYSMGVILYETLTGKLPFNDSSPIAMASAHRNTPPERPSALVPDLPSELESIILKALEKDPARRFQSAGEFLNALDPLMQSTTRFVPQRNRSATWLRFSGLAAAILCVWLLRDSILPPKAPEPAPPPVPGFTSVTLNALPWAHVVLKPASSGIQLPDFSREETTTPCTVSIPAGRYHLELTNEGIAETVRRTITVEAGKPNAFLFSFKNYNARQIATEMATAP